MHSALAKGADYGAHYIKAANFRLAAISD